MALRARLIKFPGLSKNRPLDRGRLGSEESKSRSSIWSSIRVDHGVLTFKVTRKKSVESRPVDSPFLLRHQIHLRSARVQSNCSDAFRAQAIALLVRLQAVPDGLRYQGPSYQGTKATKKDSGPL